MGDPEPGYLYARWLFLRLLGVGFTCAFLSLSRQIVGLIGPHGVLPAAEYLRQLQSGGGGFWSAPSLLWLGSGPLALGLLTAFGLAAGLALLFGLWPRLSLACSWLAYLSFVTVARNFSGFQSDGLLLELAVIGIIVAPRGLRPGLGGESPPSRAAVWLCFWTCFQLMLEAGTAKLLSGDPTWRHLTALDDYYENCPFPTVIGYWAAHLPHAFHVAACLFTLIVEVGAPLLIPFGRRARQVAFWPWVALQFGILTTGNYTFLNWSAIAIALFLLDDAALGRLLHRAPLASTPPAPSRRRQVPKATLIAAMVYVTAILFLGSLDVPVWKLPSWMLRPVDVAHRLRSANRYALFAAMTHDRPEIEFEGSRDGGQSWRVYRYKWQPQALDRAPRFMAPYLPRFDWNLWFAAVGDEYMFVARIGERLLQGEPTVLALFAENPFSDGPPALIRFPVYHYRFTDLATLRATGRYWSRTPDGEYGPRLRLDPTDHKVHVVDE